MPSREKPQHPSRKETLTNGKSPDDFLWEGRESAPPAKQTKSEPWSKTTGTDNPDDFE